MQGATEVLSRFVANIRLDDMPDGVVQNAKLLILDTVGVILAAARDSGCNLLAKWVQDQERRTSPTVIGQGFRCSPLLAALSDGHAAHALDYDDKRPLQYSNLTGRALALGEPTRVAGAEIYPCLHYRTEVCNRLDYAFDASREKLRGPNVSRMASHRNKWFFGGSSGCRSRHGFGSRTDSTAFGIAANGALRTSG